MTTYELTNSALHFNARAQDGRIHMNLVTVADGLVWSDAPYVYRLTRATEDGTVTHERLRDVRIETGDHSIVVRGTLGGMEIEHRFSVPPDRAYMEEQLSLRHSEAQPVCLLELETGFQQQVSTEIGWIPGERQSERLMAVPFRIRGSYGPAQINDYTLDQLLKRVGSEYRISAQQGGGSVPSRHHLSEGWAWTRGERTLGVFKFSQETMEWSALTPIVREDGVWLRFGGVCLTGGEPAVLTRLAPKQSVALGVTRYHPVAGDYRAAYAAFRDMLDERGCRFPADYQPPVHWNELYDSPDYGVQSPGTPGDSRNTTRHRLYTRAAMEIEATKARDYHCEALYLDPGWDTLFGSFLWNEAALGQRRKFVNELRTRFGLGLSLHCPLATWTAGPAWWTVDCGYRDNYTAWPSEAWRMDQDGKICEKLLCLGARQYLDEAERRLLEACADGAMFLMFDGNWWNDGCWNPDHGHPVPYRKADHTSASMDLCRRIHARYPKVHIEMHTTPWSAARGKRPFIWATERQTALIATGVSS